MGYNTNSRMVGSRAKRLPRDRSGKKVRRKTYLTYEAIRNKMIQMIHLEGYELWETTIWISDKYGFSQNAAIIAYRDFRKLYYGNGIRHEPLEDKLKRYNKI